MNVYRRDEKRKKNKQFRQITTLDDNKNPTEGYIKNMLKSTILFCILLRILATRHTGIFFF